MAKVQIKSEIITPFGGIFHVRELFSRFVSPVGVSSFLFPLSVTCGLHSSDILYVRIPYTFSSFRITHSPPLSGPSCLMTFIFLRRVKSRWIVRGESFILLAMELAVSTTPSTTDFLIILYNLTHISFAKLENNADVAKRFWKINAARPINKGISREIGESSQDATTQIEADCGSN